MIRTTVVLLIITALATILRLINFSPFTIYPDSYQNLIVAENLKTYGNVLGYLGKDGMLYPDFFMWTRPMYAGLIALFGNARLIALILGIAAIPLAFFTFKTILGKTQALIAAAILALSFNHTIWSGFIMTESVGVFFMLLFLWSFFRKNYVLAGFLFALAILTRYEYAIIFLPILYLTFKLERNPIHSISKLSLTTILTLSLAIFTLYPWQSMLPVIFNQLSSLLIRAGVLIVIFTLSVLLYRNISTKLKSKLSKLIPIALTLLLILFPLVLPFIDALNFIESFVRHDVLISIFSLIGLLMMLKNKSVRPYAYFSLFAITTLAIIYNRINPEMERYMTHTIPFLLIPASYSLNVILAGHARMTIVLVVLLAIFQILLTANGLRYLQDPSWYRESYQEKAAEIMARSCHSRLRGDDTMRSSDFVLLVSTPEPYYLKTKLITHSLTDTYPYIYIPEKLNNKTVIIVEDMSMHDYFPNFTRILETKLQKYKITEYKINEQYHTTTKSIEERYPVNVYEMKVGELRKVLK